MMGEVLVVDAAKAPSDRSMRTNSDRNYPNMTIGLGDVVVRKQAIPEWPISQDAHRFSVVDVYIDSEGVGWLWLINITDSRRSFPFTGRADHFVVDVSDPHQRATGRASDFVVDATEAPQDEQ